MTRVPVRFRQADVARALKGALSAGLKVGGIEIKRDGAIVILSQGASSTTEIDDPFAKWEAGYRARQT